MSRVHVRLPRAALALSIALCVGTAWAQEHPHHGHAPTTPVQEPQQEHAQHRPSQHDHSTMDHAAMGHEVAEQPGEPVPPLTDADRAAAFPVLQHGMHHAAESNWFVLFDRLEAVDLDDGRGEAWEASAWFGSDLVPDIAGLAPLYGRSVSPWWDVGAGVKHDFKPGDSQTWAAFGVQGLARY